MFPAEIVPQLYPVVNGVRKPKLSAAQAAAAPRSLSAPWFGTVHGPKEVHHA
jgi:hypothetical protein